ncbi:MAG: hypothetical protein HC831_10715 [Chloroflexia bacterium]|nr:hypothetical protein [Chloroflexia bacterium]
MKLIKLCFFVIVLLASSFDLTAQESKATKSDPNVPLFEVKNDLGQTVFAVYPGGVHIFIDDTPLKAAGGGFTVGRLGTGKAGAGDILAVSPNNVNIIIDDGNGVKAAGGGFTVGRLGTGKAAGVDNFLSITPDSTRIYVNDSIKGFAVSNIQEGSNQNFMNLNKQNYLIGHQTGFNLSDGVYNSMIGYQAGYNTTAGSNNLFLGYKSGYSNLGGGNNVYIGTESGYSTQNTFQNTFVGYRCGYSLTAASNTALGSMAGENASGSNNTFLGTSAGRKATGGNNTFIGQGAGYSSSNNTGVRNTYVGQNAGSFTTSGGHNVMLGFDAGYLNYEGSNNTFLGYDAGHNIHAGSGNVFIGNEAGLNANNVSAKLYIDNSSTETPLIYGDFDLNRLAFYGNIGVNRAAYSTVSFAVSPNGLNYGIWVDAGSTSYAAYFNGNAYTTGTWNSSDQRWKQNINDIINPLEKL